MDTKTNDVAMDVYGSIKRAAIYLLKSQGQEPTGLTLIHAQLQIHQIHTQILLNQLKQLNNLQ